MPRRCWGCWRESRKLSRRRGPGEMSAMLKTLSTTAMAHLILCVGFVTDSGLVVGRCHDVAMNSKLSMRWVSVCHFATVEVEVEGI